MTRDARGSGAAWPLPGGCTGGGSRSYYRRCDNSGMGVPWLLVCVLLASGIQAGFGPTAVALADDSDEGLGRAAASAKLRAASKAANENDSRRAVQLATEAIAADESIAEAWYLRGRENFRLGAVKQSVADFDAYVKRRPGAASRQWERGIACYYAGMYRKGAEQFALYQTYHDNDVENSVWRFLCMAPTEGVDKARAAMLPIKNDRRVPMMQIYELFAGKLKPEDVLKAVDEGDPPAAVRAGRLFYAQLYLGLYYEVHGQAELARKYVMASVDDHHQTMTINRYMWDVARIHAQKLKSQK